MASRADAIRQKQIEIDDIDRDMRSINPALSLYERLAEKRKRLEAELKKLEEGVV